MTSVEARRASPALDTVVRAAIGHRLPGCSPWPDEPLDDERFEQAIMIGAHHRLLGALAEAAADESFVMSPRQRDRLVELHRGSLVHVLHLERLLVEIVELFEMTGIEFRLLKGSSLVHQVYTDPSWRISGDIDLLIAPDRLQEAVGLVRQHFGGEVAVPELRPSFDERLCPLPGFVGNVVVWSARGRHDSVHSSGRAAVRSFDFVVS